MSTQKLVAPFGTDECSAWDNDSGAGKDKVKQSAAASVPPCHFISICVRLEALALMLFFCFRVSPDHLVTRGSFTDFTFHFSPSRHLSLVYFILLFFFLSV